MMIPIVSAGRGIGHEKQAEARLEVFRDVYKLGKYNWLIHGQPIDYEHVLPVLHRWHKDLGECVYLDVSKEVYEARQVKRKHRPSYEEQYKNRDRDIQTLKGFFREVKIFTV